MTDAEIQNVSAEIFEAARQVIVTKHADIDMREGWVAVVTAGLALIAMYIDAVDPKDKVVARDSVMQALQQRIGELN
jgi:hypothetical protein